MDLTTGNAARPAVSTVTVTCSGTEAAKTKSSLSAFSPAAFMAAAVPPVASHRGRKKYMRTPHLLLFAVLTAMFYCIAYATPPYDPYSPRKPYDLDIGGHKITICAVRVMTYSATGTRALEVQYRPSSQSTNMWTHIVEMYAIAQHFGGVAKEENAPKVAVTPLIYSESSGRQNTTYTYSIVDGVATPDWHVEFQPWFKDKKEDA